MANHSVKAIEASPVEAIDRWDGNEYWERFGLSACPRFDGKTVLEIGCGEGRRCLEAAAHGAVRVVGIDPLEAQVAACHRVQARSPHPERDRVSFVVATLETLPPERFDIVISESALEHVMDVAALLAHVRSRLNPGGKFYLGFGPLYHAPDGDHGWLRAVLPGRRFFLWPWGHLLFEGYAFRQLSKVHGKALTRTHDWPYLDLNRHTLAQYEAMFRDSGMRVTYVRKNHMRSRKARLFAALGDLPILSKYFAINMFVIFEVP
jgi:SAM-dependent methyltransferase